MGEGGSASNGLTDRTPPEVQRASWPVAYICLAIGWVVIVGISVLALATATGGKPAGILLLAGFGVFFTVVVALFRRPPIVRRKG